MLFRSRDRFLAESFAYQPSVARALDLLGVPVTPQRLVAPADLAAIGFAMLLGVQAGGLDGRAGVGEEEAGHGEGCRGSYDGLWHWQGVSCALYYIVVYSQLRQ